MNVWKKTEDMPKDYHGDCWVLVAGDPEPSLAHVPFDTSNKKRFQEIWSVLDREGLNVEYYNNVTHYAEIVPPEVPLEMLNKKLFDTDAEKV